MKERINVVPNQERLKFKARNAKQYVSNSLVQLVFRRYTNEIK